jgi:hypothetical protein
MERAFDAARSRSYFTGETMYAAAISLRLRQKMSMMRETKKHLQASCRVPQVRITIVLINFGQPSVI